MSNVQTPPTLDRYHFTHKTLLNPTDAISVYVIGAGGTGSQVVTGLARINEALTQLGHPGLQVTLWDDDVVTEANLGRQLFAPAEIGLHKSVALINRINRFFGLTYQARTCRYDGTTDRKERAANIIITCVDTVASRIEIGEYLSKIKDEHWRNQPRYWLDFGNGQHTGQVLLATVGKHKQPLSAKFLPVAQMPLPTEEFADHYARPETDEGPSCSLAEALNKQDLFINSTLANYGCALLWRMFREGMIAHRGLYLNLSDFRSQPIAV